MKFSAVLALAFVTVVAAAPTQRSIFTDPYTIHPDGDKTKCVGVLGGKFVVNATIDMCIFFDSSYIEAHAFV
jgi:hypothetical protein